MNNVQPEHQQTVLAGLPLISVVRLENSVKIYAMLHIPLGYKFKEITHTHDTGATPPDISNVVLETGTGNSVQTILVKEIPTSPGPFQTMVKVSGGPEPFEVVVDHLPGSAPFDEDSTLDRPFAYLQNEGAKRAVHYSTWIPDSCDMNINNSITSPSSWNHDIIVNNNPSTSAEMTLFRNCIWITKTPSEDWPDLTIGIERNGKTKKVMVSTNDGSVGTGDEQNVPKA